MMLGDRPITSSNHARTETEEPVRKFVSLSTDVRIEYVEQGRTEANGVAVIFLHGVTDSWRSFERVLQLLPPSIHAFALSQRGHGDSSRPTSGYRFADMSADLLA